MNPDLIAYNSMLAAQEAAKWMLWSMIGTWFAGLATFLAVCVSLYLGLRKPKANISCRVGESLTWVGAYQKRGVSIVVTNRALVPVKITAINWVFKKDISFYQPFYSNQSMQLPKSLDYGEQAVFWIDLDEQSDWIKKIAEGIKEHGGMIEDFKCEVSTTTDERFIFEINKSLINKIRYSYLKLY